MIPFDRPLVSLRILAIIPVVLFLPTLGAVFVGAPEWVNNLTGIFFHLSMVFVVARIPAPEWARASAYAWLTLDIACGVMLYSGVEFETAWPIRLGGHLFAAIWMITISILIRSWWIRTVGLVTAINLIAYTFFAFALPVTFLGPAGLLTCVWFGLIAWKAPTLIEPKMVSAL